jgi:hypothetical protein
MNSRGKEGTKPKYQIDCKTLDHNESPEYGLLRPKRRNCSVKKEAYSRDGGVKHDSAIGRAARNL